MENLNQSLYEKIDEFKKRRDSQKEKVASHASHASHNGLSLCNNDKNYGTINGTVRTYPRPNNEIEQAEDRLTEIWDNALDDRATVANFEAAVNQWYDLQIEGVRLHQIQNPKLEPTSTDMEQKIKEAVQKEQLLYGKDSEQSKIAELEQRIIDALQGQPVPIQLSPCEQILEVEGYAKAEARNAYHQSKWVKNAARARLVSLGVEC